MKRFSKKRGTRDGVESSGVVRASLLLASDLPSESWVLASSSCSTESIKRLTHGLYRVVQDTEAIAKKEEKDQGRDSSKQMAGPLGMELLEL